jgi:glycosyltransferase involved in cell wall biosynthesis
MTYAERDSIRDVIDTFFATGVVDEVLVVDNNAQSGTREELEQTQARLVHEPCQGYGHATRRGLLEARASLVVVAEPDGTFKPEDITKLLVYSSEPVRSSGCGPAPFGADPTARCAVLEEGPNRLASSAG